MNFIGRFFSKIEGHKERESFPVGWLAEGKTLVELREYLHREWGFGGNFSTHTDSGEVLNWRKLLENGQQYHLRVYEDGEIRGHIEMSPEKNAISNFTKGGQSESREEFIKFLGDFVSKRKYISNLVPDLQAHNPDAEVIKNQE
jgi:hypothetical protein